MSNYSKPIISIDNGMAESVYAASGADGCYTATARIEQTPEIGRDNYVIHVDGKHNADHTKEAQLLTISFNQNVNYVSGGAGLLSGDWNTYIKSQIIISPESIR